MPMRSLALGASFKLSGRCAWGMRSRVEFGPSLVALRWSPSKAENARTEAAEALMIICNLHFILLFVLFLTRTQFLLSPSHRITPVLLGLILLASAVPT